ncbi:hypothetical protein BKA62DRAFT_773740 [Auriculariales sp. MPI-PUGE-AT-0066]|nr:hypothetical protein BKA62DRAFT_773740 [Auriculariales sp. MPI-PUGE-AT-0066]
MFALALREPIFAAVPRMSAVAANPTICSPRLFSSFTPASSPIAKPKPTTGVDTVHKQPTKKIRGSIKKTKEPTKYIAASPELTTASRARERGQKPKLMAIETRDEVKIKELRAEVKAIPKQPKGPTTSFALYIQHCYETDEVTGKYGSVIYEVAGMWKKLSDTERQKFTEDAENTNQQRAAEYDEWVEAVGYTKMCNIHRLAEHTGKRKPRIPSSLRPFRKWSVFTTFFEAKVASGEVSHSEGFAAAMKRTGELWRRLTPSEKAVYEDLSEADSDRK